MVNHFDSNYQADRFEASLKRHKVGIVDALKFDQNLPRLYDRMNFSAQLHRPSSDDLRLAELRLKSLSI